MIRTIIWFIWFTISLLISIPFMFRVKYLIKKNRIKESEALIYKCSNSWANSLLRLAGVKVNVHGIENIPEDETVLFVGNHQGNFDIPIYITQIPKIIGFISKVEVEKLPVVRTWMKFMYCVFMDRSNLRKSGEAIIRGVKNLKTGHSMVIFPEGTRSKGGPIKEFKAGSFKLATKSKCPIVPVTMDGSYKIMEHGNGPWIKPGVVNIYFHPIIRTADLDKEEQELLCKKVQNIISSAISK